MVLKSLATFTKLLLLLSLSMSCWMTSAQAQTAPQTETTTDKAKSSGPRKQLATIVFAGLGGAVLGLSTLSFYGRPQENLRNIAIGAAFGVIAGTTLVTYKAATNPSELYGNQREIEKRFEETTVANFTPSTAPSRESPFGLRSSWSF